MSQYVVTMRLYVESDDLFEKETAELSLKEIALFYFNKISSRIVTF